MALSDLGQRGALHISSSLSMMNHRKWWQKLGHAAHPHTVKRCRSSDWIQSWKVASVKGWVIWVKMSRRMFGFGGETKQIRSDLSSTPPWSSTVWGFFWQSMQPIFDPILQPGVRPPLGSREWLPWSTRQRSFPRSTHVWTSCFLHISTCHLQT